MLAEAPNSTRVFYACGSAEELPILSDSIDVIFISMAFHHFTNPKLAAHECRRVLRSRGRLCLRTASREQIPQYAYVPYFPASVPILERRLPTMEFQRRTFEDAGFGVLFSGIVNQQIASSCAEYADKLALKADSILASLDDKDFDSGLAAMRAANPAGPVVEPIDLLVMEFEGR